MGEIRGLYLHGHFVSQLVSTLEDNRPLVWWLPFWGDWLWVGCWPIISGLTISLGRNHLEQGLATVSSMVILSGVCWLVLIQGGWLGWIPGIIVIIFTTTDTWIDQTKTKYQ